MWPVGIQGLAAEGARRPPGCHRAERALHEGADGERRQADADQVRAVRIAVVDLERGRGVILGLVLVGVVLFVLRVIVVVGLVISSSSASSCARASTTTCSRCGSQPSVMVPTRNASTSGSPSGRGVVVGRRERLRDLDASAGDLRDQERQALGEDLDLDLLEDDRDERAALARLQEERAMAGLADGAGHEPVRDSEVVDATRHEWASGRVGCLGDSSAVAAGFAVACRLPPWAASRPHVRGRPSCGGGRPLASGAIRRRHRRRGRRTEESGPRQRAAARARRAGGFGISGSTPPPVSLTRTTNGRSSAYRTTVREAGIDRRSAGSRRDGVPGASATSALMTSRVADDGVRRVRTRGGRSSHGSPPRPGLPSSARPSPSGKIGRRRVALHDAPERLLPEVLELATGPAAVADLADPLLHVERRERAGRPAMQQRRRSPGSAPGGRSRRLPAAPRAAARRAPLTCPRPRSSRWIAGRPAGEHRARDGRQPMADEQDGRHAGATRRPWMARGRARRARSPSDSAVRSTANGGSASPS